MTLACDANGAEDDAADGTPPPTGGAAGGAGAPAGGAGSTGAPSGGGGSGGAPNPVGFVSPVQQGSGASTERYATFPVVRNGQEYFFMANGWGPGFQSQTVSWQGTSFTVNSMAGTTSPPMFQPASYPTVFCGKYSDKASGPCGLPNTLAAIPRLRTGWRWQPNGNAGQYNAAYDIWLSNSTEITGHNAYVMVWLRDPPGQQPAGQPRMMGVSVPNAPGTWNLWVGVINNKPCISYVRPEGQDIYELEFDALDFVRDATSRGVAPASSHILSVAVGFEIWEGPITNLVSTDFYVSAM